MSALRDERGLRAAERNAEPQVVGLAPQTTVMTERANTMKTYVLRDPNPVEPQNCKPPPRPQRQPAAPAAPKPAPGPTLFIGLDVHNDSIAVSLAPSDSPEVRRYGIIGGQHDDVLKLLKKLAAAHPGAALQCCYEAGPRGYPLCRCLRQHGAECIIVSPSKVPRLPGDRVKTDRRDADQLARLFRAGELTGIFVPDAGDEAIRDLVRGRESARVRPMIAEAVNAGVHFIAGGLHDDGSVLAPVVLGGATPAHRLLHEDAFAPVLVVVTVASDDEAVTRANDSPFALGASVFTRDQTAARQLAARLNAGVVSLNDLIIPTADAHIPFGGRKRSGFGVTRGAEGLLELTAPKVITVSRSKFRPAFDPPHPKDEAMFQAYLELTHGRGLGQRCRALQQLVRAVMKRGKGGLT